LSGAERTFFRDTDPLGFILFQRNCVNPDQVRALVSDLRECVGRADAPILIDQEGGRVQRLKPPHWRAAPAAARFGELAAVDRAGAAEAVRLNARLIAAELVSLGITVNCAPLLDVPQSGTDPVIGDRALGTTAELAAFLGEAACEGFLDGGVLPVIKHIPGHGRAGVDSHAALPVVTASVAELEEVDFAPFRALSRMPWAMTGHVVYAGIDDGAPATTSASVIERIIRGHMGFDGVLVSDDLSMQALDGTLGARAAAALAAGCDVALHCNGTMDEMMDVATTTGPLSDAAVARIGRGEAMRREPGAFDRTAALARLGELLGEGEGA
jgi:beta-N-acetylhexosaminidase